MAPSVQNESPSKDIIHLKGMVAQHAYMRIQLFYMCALSLEKLALRSDGTTRNIEVKIAAARLQCGQGTDGTHAAHSNAAAGASDNLKKLLIQEILDDQFYTPQKRKMLMSRGFSEEDLTQLLNLTTDESAFLELFYQIWPSYARQPESINEDTEGHIITSGTTTEVPRIVNLVCDKRLENAIRPIICDLYARIMKGDISPEDATKEFHSIVKNHFMTATTNIEQRITDLKTYTHHLRILKARRITPGHEQEWLKTMEETVQLKRKLQENVDPGTPNVLFKHVGGIFQHNRRNSAGDIILSVKTRLKEHYDEIVRQASEQAERLEQLLMFTKSQENGTKLPDLDLLKNMDSRNPANAEPIQPSQAAESDWAEKTMPPKRSFIRRNLTDTEEYKENTPPDLFTSSSQNTDSYDL